MRRKIAMFCIVVAAVWTVGAAVVFIKQRAMIFPAPEGRYGPEAGGLSGIVRAVVEAGDGTPIEVWRSPVAPGQPVVLLFHGNGSLNADGTGRITAARAAGFAVAAMEYRGYNGNPGHPSQEALVGDGRAVIAALAREGIAPGSIVLWGHSLGTGVAMQIAAGENFRGLVLEAPFLALSDIAAARFPYFPSPLLIRDPFLSRDVAAKVTSPALILAGSKDGLVPPDNSRRLAALIPAARFVEIEGAGHDDLGAFPQARDAIAAFLRTSAG